MIFLYHSIVPDDSPADRWLAGQAIKQSDFERHIGWLAKHHRIVSLSEYVSGLQQECNKQKPIAITFDDGLWITFQCVFPFLTEMNIPATIFVSTEHLESGNLLWFSYLKALCFEKLYQIIEVDQRQFPLRTFKECRQSWDELRALAKASGNPSLFCKTLVKAYPLTRQVSDFYGGMSHDQVIEAGNSNLLDLGAHTVTHPYLNQIGREMQKQEIVESKRILADLVEMPIPYFAYPGGEYNRDSLEVATTAGFEAAFAVIPKSLGTDPQFEIGRIGIYSPSLLKLQLKTMGVADLARRFGFRVG